MRVEILNKTVRDTQAVLSHPRLWQKIIKEYKNTNMENIDIDACGKDNESFANYIDSRFKKMFHYYHFHLFRFWYPVNGQKTHKCTVQNGEWYEYVKPSVFKGSDIAIIFLAVFTEYGEKEKQCIEFFHGTCATSTKFSKNDDIKIACDSPTDGNICTTSFHNRNLTEARPKKKCPDGTMVDVTQQKFCLI